MASSTPVCSICDLRNIAKPSIIWCYECDEGLCPECKDHHSLSKGSRNHNTVTISEYQELPSEIVKITQNCANHNEKFTIYCKKHECLCCGSCIVENHIECRAFDKLADIFQNTKFSNAFEEIEQSLADLFNNIQKIQNDRKTNLKRLGEKKRQIEQEIKQTRIAIDTYLDKIQEDIMNKLNGTEEKESKLMSEMLELLKEKESEITEYRKTIENIKQHATDLQTFIWMKELENKVSSKDKFLQSVIDSENFKDCELLYNPNAAMQNIANFIKNFGEVIIETKPCDVVLTRRKDKQAQMMLQYTLSKSVDTINLNRLRTINTMGNDNRGCCMLPDGRMAFTNYSSPSVRVFKSDGSNDFGVNTVIYAFDIAYNYEDNTLAVTSGSSGRQSIRIIDIQSKKIRNTILVDSDYYGIAVKDGKVICSGDEKGIQLLNLHNIQTSDIVRNKIPPNCYVATLGDKIYHTNHQTNSVTCYDLQGTVQWTFKNKSVLRGPNGISIDNDGNVYVVGNASNNVVVISADGQQHKEILTASDGLSNSFSLDYARNTNQLLVANCQYKAMIFTIN